MRINYRIKKDAEKASYQNIIAIDQGIIKIEYMIYVNKKTTACNDRRLHMARIN